MIKNYIFFFSPKERKRPDDGPKKAPDTEKSEKSDKPKDDNKDSTPVKDKDSGKSPVKKDETKPAAEKEAAKKVATPGTANASQKVFCFCHRSVVFFFGRKFELFGKFC